MELNYKNLKVINHPLLTHKISILRNKNTPCKEFREVVKEVSLLESYEVLRDVETKNVTFDTPIETTTAEMVDGKKLCFVPILRAGIGMVDGFLEMIPTASVGHIGLYRDEKTHKPVEYYCKLPKDISTKKVYLLDPMLATGGSAIDAVKLLKNHGVKKVTFVCIIAAPEGIKAFMETYKDINLYVGAIDRELNSNAYICPGLGDCGDRIFSTIDNK